MRQRAGQKSRLSTAEQWVARGFESGRQALESGGENRDTNGADAEQKTDDASVDDISGS